MKNEKALEDLSKLLKKNIVDNNIHNISHSYENTSIGVNSYEYSDEDITELLSRNDVVEITFSGDLLIVEFDTVEHAEAFLMES